MASTARHKRGGLMPIERGRSRHIDKFTNCKAMRHGPLKAKARRSLRRAGEIACDAVA
jgi:hypothetical protein